MITVLIGKSASGKDTIFKELLKHSFEPIVTFTTRPKREGETDGVEYNFVSEKDFKDLDLLEKREYNTAKGIWYYGMPKVDVDKNYAVILDINGANKLIDYYGKDKILPAYLACPLSVREKRAMQRGSFDKEEWDRRAIADDIDLDITKLKETTNSLLYCTDNDFLNNCNNTLFIEPVTTPTEIADSISYYANLIDKSIDSPINNINYEKPDIDIAD